MQATVFTGTAHITDIPQWLSGADRKGLDPDTEKAIREAAMHGDLRQGLVRTKAEETLTRSGDTARLSFSLREMRAASLAITVYEVRRTSLHPDGVPGAPAVERGWRRLYSDRQAAAERWEDETAGVTAF
jgi:hypothetical protein